MKINTESIINDALVLTVISGRYPELSDEPQLLQRGLDLASLSYPSVPLIFPFEKECSVTVRTSLSAFQRCSGLEETGMCDRKTIEKLQKLCFYSLKLREYIRCINEAEKNDQLFSEQKTVMAALGMVCMFNHDIMQTDFSDDEEYSEKLKKFQSYFGIDASGELDKCTERRLREAVNCIRNVLPQRFFGQCRRQYPGKILQRGMSGTDVSVLQSCMRYLSFVNGKIFFRNITGKYDKETEDAVRTYQKVYGLYENGYVDFFTWNGIVNF